MIIVQRSIKTGSVVGFSNMVMGADLVVLQWKTLYCALKVYTWSTDKLDHHDISIDIYYLGSGRSTPVIDVQNPFTTLA